MVALSYLIWQEKENWAYGVLYVHLFLIKKSIKDDLY